MAHKVVVGGFGSSERHMRRVAEKLSSHFDEDVHGISFRRANTDREHLFRALKNAEVITHSGGMPSIRHTSPETIHGIAPPLRASPTTLLARAAFCGYDMIKESLSSNERRGKMSECGREVATETALFLPSNLGRVGMIAAFDAIEAGIDAKEVGIRVGLGFMNQDRLFAPEREDLQKAAAANLPVVMLDGCHVEFAYDPVGVVAEYEAKMTDERLMRSEDVPVA